MEGLLDLAFVVWVCQQAMSVSLVSLEQREKQLAGSFSVESMG